MSRQLPLITVPFKTRLFSTDFLEHEFREWPEWKEGQGVFDPLGINIGHLLDGARRHGDNEDQLRADFIVPVLDELGWKDCYNTQAPVTIEKARNAKKADYALYASPADKKRALERKSNEKEYWRDALAVLEAKAWDRPLDTRPGPGKDFSNQFPRYQIHQYMRYSQRRWGILTNGKLWRLIHTDTSHDYDVHYEADLESLLEDLDIPENLFYFSLFFRREAFTPDETGACFLDRVLRQSRDARIQLEDNLKEVVGGALHALMDGFARHSPNGIKPGDDLAPVKEAALILLYRLLFVFNAEDRGILPVENDQYRNALGFVTIARDLKEKLDREVRLPHDAFSLWESLKDLFKHINAGYRDNGHVALTAYNGGLFNPESPMGHDLERWRIGNNSLACAIDFLYWRLVNRQRRAVRYRDMDIRHLGNIYEGLLELHPRWDGGAVVVGTAKGERKTSGSYYTPDFIVRHIVENTLGPLCDGLENAEAEKPGKGRRKAAAPARPGGARFSDRVLALRVLDPAMGSGHFLIEAADYLARRLAEHDPPSDDDGKAAKEAVFAYWKRQVAEHCLYGVDLNPLAVELGKLALWMHTLQRDKALSFLDHHIRCGNSLVSARLDRMGSPPELSKKKADRPQTQLDLPLFMQNLKAALEKAVREYHAILAEPSDTADQVHEKEDRLDKARELLAPFREAADVWTSALFGNPLDTAEWADWSGKIGSAEKRRTPAFVEKAKALALRFNFFHAFLEFPETVFKADGAFREDIGFDAIIMNPPWERVKLQENEFFAQRDEAIALAPTAAKRKTMIAALEKKNPALWREYESAKEKADDTLAFLHGSGGFPLMGRGDTNYYSVFAESALSVVAPGGRIGMVTPSGIASDKGSQDFFSLLVDQKRLVELKDFENRYHEMNEEEREVTLRHFEDVDSRFKFAISILSGPGTGLESFECGFYLAHPSEIKGPNCIRLTPEDIALVNPNTKTCPVFRTQRDAELTRAVYRRVPVLIRREGKRETNPWGISFLRMFDMTNDSGLFMTAAELKKGGYWLGEGNVFQKGKSRYLPLYEGKMVQMYDHRAARVVVNPKNLHRPAVPESLTDAEKAKPDTLASPQFWVDYSNVAGRLGEWDRGWMFCFKDITSPTNQRTMICSLIPRTAVGNKLPVILSPKHELYPALVSNLSSFVFDFVTRQKLGGQTLNFFVIEQLPVLPPKDYEKPLAKGKKTTVADFIRPRVLELVYTANDMEPFARDMGHKGKPFKWNPERRVHLQCQLDALFFHLYGLTREETDYVMSTFPIVREKDEKENGGRYRTRDLILDYFNAYAAGDWDAQVKG